MRSESRPNAAVSGADDEYPVTCGVLIADIPQHISHLELTAKHVSVIQKISDESYAKGVPMSRLQAVDGVVFVDMVESSECSSECFVSTVERSEWSQQLLASRSGKFICRTLARKNFTSSEIAELLQQSWLDQKQLNALLLGALFWRLVIKPPQTSLDPTFNLRHSTSG